MKNPFEQSSIQVVGGLVIVGVAVILGLTKFSFPASSTHLPSMSTYTFPGKLPDDQIVNQQVRLTTTKGEIVIALDPAQAPLAVSNFVYLVQQKFYDGIIWHRLAPNFVIQAGDPQTKDRSVNPERWGTGGPGYQFPDEPVTGEYTAGTVAMANAGPNTNGSQFFIVLEDQPGLPKAYTIFGRVTSGMEVVHMVVKGDVITTAVVEPIS
jgi:cyclophilin family peptidyl-prolyl cis-trans isomerase